MFDEMPAKLAPNDQTPAEYLAAYKSQYIVCALAAHDGNVTCARFRCRQINADARSGPTRNPEALHTDHLRMPGSKQQARSSYKTAPISSLAILLGSLVRRLRSGSGLAQCELAM